MVSVKHYLFAMTVLGLTLPHSATVYADANDTTLSAGGNPEAGRRVFNRCKACHNLTNSGRSRLGPNLGSLFGRKAGTTEGYKYSRALKDSDFSWTEKNLNEWLTKPNSFLPGNKMQFSGVPRESDRKNLIAYLRQATISSKQN
ncbi:MAG: cytochrome c family protein [Kordiimonas sp.]